MSKVVKMIKAEKTKWVKALRSGKYKRGEGALLDEGAYCCLGVAEVAIAGKQPQEGPHYLPHGRYGLTQRIQSALAGCNDGDDREHIEHQFEKAGFDTIPKGSRVSNGDRRSSFKQIADWIEANL